MRSRSPPTSTQVRGHGRARRAAARDRVRAQGPVRHVRHAQHLRRRCALRRRSRARRRHIRRAAASRRRDHPRQSQSRRVRIRNSAQLVRRHVLQSVRHRAQPHGLELGIRLGRRREPRDLRDRRGNGRLDPQPGARRERRRHLSDTRAREPRRHDPSRHQHARRADLPHGRRCRARAAGGRGLRPEGRADRFQHRPLAAGAIRCVRARAAARRPHDRRRPRVHGQEPVHGDGPRDDRHRRSRRRRPRVARCTDRRSRPERRVVRRLCAPIRPAALPLAVHAAVTRALSRRRRGQARRETT